MDAQNAGEPTSTKPAASPKRMGSDADQPRSSAVTKLSSIAKPDLSARDGSRSSVSGSHPHPHDDNNNNNNSDGNSDAETIVLPGKDNQHSPSKVRKHIKHEDKSDGEDAPPISSIGRKHSNVNRGRENDINNNSNNNNSNSNNNNANSNTSTSHRDRGESTSSRYDRGGDRGDRGDRGGKSSRAASLARNGPGSIDTSALGPKKKKQHPDKAKMKDGSSGLSSAPASPPQRRRRLSYAHSKSDSEPAPVDSPKSSAKEKQPQQQPHSSKQAAAGDKLVPHKRKATRPESDDEAESRKVRRQRTSGSGLDASRKPHLPSAKSHHEAHSSTRTRSPSPPARPHRRSISSQLPGHSSNGLSHKKKRIPAPLQSTDYHSDESSASGSPHPRSSKLRNLATPATAESTVSPMKMAPHKKHLDAHGQTFLARACAKGEYEIAKQRLQERPEDINVADYAGNTPLQIAALNGYEDIVKLLVEAGCNLDCVNNEKDTPLLDAVENGHLGVVKILLDAGVNPRKANAHGEEPIFRIDDSTEHAAEIKRALLEAKKKMMGERRLTSEDHHPDHFDALSPHGAESPRRRSPGISGPAHPSSGRRAGNVRANKTSNHLLYMPMDNKTLRVAAARGDEELVERILAVKEGFGDAESLVAAARGGHEMVMQLLMALGNAHPDPPPIPTDPSNSDYATPILAAIGQENIKVIKLLLGQAEFNPTQRYKGETYYDIARKRRGPNWIEEEHLLKTAYDEYKKNHKGNQKSRSPSRQDQSRDSRKNRGEPPAKDDATARSHKPKASSPTREPKKPSQAKLTASPKEKHRSGSFSGHQEDQASPKRGPGRPKKEDRIPTIAISDREASPARKPAVKTKRAAESDLAAASSEGEAVKPRRKLVSAREFKGEQKIRRASLTSNASSLKEPSSPRDEGEKVTKMDKYHDRTKALKRDESRDRLSVAGEYTGKRHRSSATPPHPGAGDKEPGEGGPAKKRRLDADGKERRLKPTTSDDKHLKAAAPARDSAPSPAAGSRTSSKGARDDDERRPTPKPKKAELQADHARRETSKSVSSEHNVRVKDEDPDVEMPDADQPPKDIAEARVSLQRKRDEDERLRKRQQARDDEAAAREARKKEEERKRREEEEKEKEKELQEKERLRLAEETKRRAEAEARQRAEEQQRQKEEEEKQRKEEEERRKREEELRKQKEQEERRQEEERRKRAEEEQRQKEELERKKREEEERIHREQLERKAAEEAEAQRKREEEERNERERIQREAEQRAREAERKRRAELERARVEKLPPLLRWLETAVNPKQPEAAKLFSLMQGVRYDCIDTTANDTAEGREQWLLNTQVALLLGEKDLDLSRYTAWPRKPVSPAAKSSIWRVEADRYSLTEQSLYELGRQLPDYYEGKIPEQMGHETCRRLKTDAWDKFSAMEMFFVKVSDFMYIVPNIPHLRNVELTIQYREFAADGGWRSEKKFKRDPDAARYHGYVPDSKHYLNGELLTGSKSGAQLAVVSSAPFPTHKVVRRGFTAISQDDPEYNSLLYKQHQNLDDSIGDIDSPLLANGVSNSSPMSTSSHHLMQEVTNGVRSPVLVTATAATAATANGASAHHHLNQPISPSSESGPAQARPLVNGTHRLANGDSRDNA